MAVNTRLISSGLFLIMVTTLSAWQALSAIDGVHRGAIVAVILATFIALARPSFALGIMLLLLPVFGGNGPARPQTILFYQIFAGLVTGLGARWLAYLYQTRGPIRLNLSNPLIFFFMLYIAISAMSLTSLPIYEVLRAWDDNAFQRALRFISVSETSVLYPFLTVLLQFQALLIFLLLVNYPSTWHFSHRAWILSILLGLVASLLAGLLDYHSLINLRSLRALDPLVNPGDIQQRLQSFFGHSGWYAEYVTMTVPCALIILTLNINRRLQIGLLILLLVMVEYILILTFQRGGWLSYPLTVLVIWFSVYVLRPGNAETSFFTTIRKSLLKICLSVPITITLSLCLIVIFSQQFSTGKYSGSTVKKYTDRFQKIVQASDRTRYIPVALKLTAIHPIMGGGNESFAYRYVESYMSPGGRYVNTPKPPIGGYYGSAHNVYLQTLTGKGIAGLVSLFNMLAAALFIVARHIKNGFALSNPKDTLTHTQKILSMIVLCYTFAFLIYGNVQEIFYIPSLTVLLFVILGIFVAQVPSSLRLSVKSQKTIAFLLIGLFLSHLFWEYVYPGETRRINSALMKRYSYERNCYGIESNGVNRWQWCRNNARVKLPLTKQDMGELVLRLSAVNPDLQNNPLTVRYGGHDGPIHQVIFTPEQASVEIRIPMDDSYVVETAASGGVPADRFAVLSLDVSRTWVPKAWGINTDTRELGVAVQLPVLVKNALK